MQIATFEATCGDCKKSFSYPDRGDFAYGEFIFTGLNGNVFAHYAAIGNPISGDIERVIPEENRNNAELFQEALAYFADSIEGQKLTNKKICPHCLSSNWATWGGTRTGSIEVPEATYNDFLHLSISERETKVRVLIEAKP